MNKPHDFVNLYELLDVDPACSFRELETAWHELAKKYHPDNAATGDVAIFTEIVGAYRVLKNPETRGEYDRKHFPNLKARPVDAAVDISGLMDDKTASDDAEMHDRILISLYRRRRENPSEPGILQWLLQEKLECPEAQFEFHVWYLKSKGFIEVTESSALAITIAGVDEVISTTRADPSRAMLFLSTQPPLQPED